MRRMLYASRSEALGFAQRARANLKHIQEARRGGSDIHEVTQIGLSLLGIVVFPREQQLLNRLPKKRLEVLYLQGWPRWHIQLGTAKTLSDLIDRVRNATAHGRIKFSSESREPTDVMVTVEDAKSKTSPVTWRAEILASDLRDFCFRFLDLIEDEIG